MSNLRVILNLFSIVVCIIISFCSALDCDVFVHKVAQPSYIVPLASRFNVF